MKPTRYTGLALLLIGAATAQAQTQVPNTFQSGQPARAADVNANFDTLQTAIDQSVADIQQLQQTVGITWKGAWQNGVVYARLDLVEYQGSTFLAVQDTSGVEDPSNTSFWSLFAAGGNDGATGPQGSVGPQGPVGPKGDSGATGPAGRRCPCAGPWQTYPCPRRFHRAEAPLRGFLRPWPTVP